MIFGLFKTMYFFILHFEVRNLGYKPMLGARAGKEGTSEQFAPLLASLKKFYTQKTANQK